MKLMLIVIMCVLIVGHGIVTTSGCAAERAGKPAAKPMKKQHQTMLTVGAQWNKAKQALAKGDFQSAEPAVRKLIDVTPNIENFQLHRSPEKREEFVRYYEAFDRDLNQLKRTVFAEDAAASAKLVKDIDNACKQCHTAFGGGHRHSPKSKGR